MSEGFGLRIQLLEWGAALFALYLFFRENAMKKYLEPRRDQVSINQFIIGFFVLALLAKVSQYFSLGMNAQDFWLFTEIFESIQRQKFFLTHFGPQAWGPVQHGAVHPFIPWAILTPFTYLIGGVGVSLLFNPACFAFAALFLNRILTTLKLAALPRLLLIIAFLFSKQSSLTIMYEVHPEALYPLLSFGFILALIEERFFYSLLWGALLGILKEDSFMAVWGCLVVALALSPKLRQKKIQLAVSIGLSAIFYGIQVKLIQYYNLHDNGGIIPATGTLVGNHKWTGFSSIIETGNTLIAMNGGIGGTLKAYGHFLISDSWRGLLFAAPWLVISPAFWVAEFPLSFSFSLRGTNAVFWNYYSIPFVAFFWILAGNSIVAKKNLRWPLAILILSLLNGSESLVIQIPTSKLLAYRAEASSYDAIISKLPNNGVVIARLIPFVPLKKIISDRFPGTDLEQNQVQFYFLTKDRTSYNIQMDELRARYQDLKMPSSGFQVLKETEHMVLFAKASTS